MARSKEWWARLTREERKRLVELESLQWSMALDWEDLSSVCPSCKEPISAKENLCVNCTQELESLRKKGAGK